MITYSTQNAYDRVILCHDIKGKSLEVYLGTRLYTEMYKEYEEEHDLYSCKFNGVIQTTSFFWKQHFWWTEFQWRCLSRIGRYEVYVQEDIIKFISTGVMGNNTGSKPKG